jgi:hypothetical protein
VKRKSERLKESALRKEKLNINYSKSRLSSKGRPRGKLSRLSKNKIKLQPSNKKQSTISKMIKRMRKSKKKIKLIQFLFLILDHIICSLLSNIRVCQHSEIQSLIQKKKLDQI